MQEVKKVDNRILTYEDLLQIKADYNASQERYTHQILVCGGAGCVSSNCAEVEQALHEVLEASGIAEKISVVQTGCMGTCAFGPVMLILPEEIYYTHVNPEKVKEIVEKHIIGGQYIEEYTFYDNDQQKYIPKMNDIPFFNRQVKVALRNCGRMDHGSVDAYIARDGYFAIHKALTSMQPLDVIGEVKASGLRGRGGGGFPTGIKWQAGYNAPEGQKYIICNADEGDPGAFMDRSILEGDPHSVIEAMMIGGYAIGADKGYVYVRAEYPIAVERLGAAIDEARERGLLGQKLFGSDFVFDLEIRIGAGAFVCGEETSLMKSTEGRRGEPVQKPPFPFERGLFGKPTIINNVETFANIAPIILNGGEWLAQYGTEKSKGTKVFALAGNIVNTGIVEIPMGTTLGEVVYKIGGGIPNHKSFKAAQIGGPSGGCITRENLNTPLDYESVSKLGAIMGSGGLIVMDEDTCMVDTARYFMDFIQDESCGKCTPCRLGTKRMLEILERITSGHGKEGDIELLIELGETIRRTAMCGLGQTAPNPVLSTIQYFRDEYDEHIRKSRCDAGVCGELFVSPCENACPAHINVPGYLALAAEGRFADAYRLIRQENPFPAVCGRICTHPCEFKCRRAQLDEPIAICDLKRFIADQAFMNEEITTQDLVVQRNGKSIGIIGSGPSGLTCGYYLARLGYEVHVYESNPVPGGMLNVGIPKYRLPKDVLLHEIQLIERSGVHIHLNTKVGLDISLDDLRQRHDSVYIASGTHLSKKMDVSGEDLPGVIHGIDFLREVNLGNPMEVGKKVVVIGGGNTAFDSARTALRLGAKEVTMLYRRTRYDMPADPREIEEALEEGIVIKELVSPVNVVGKDRVEAIECQEMELSGFDNSGRPRPQAKEGSIITVRADMVIPAVSQMTDLPFVDRHGAIKLTKWDTFEVNKDTQMTTMAGVFAGGDVVRGSDVAITAIADGKRAAQNIDRYLGGKGVLNKGLPIAIPQPVIDEELMEHERFSMKILDPNARKLTFDEVIVGYHRLNAIAESMRCLRCDRR